MSRSRGFSGGASVNACDRAAKPRDSAATASRSAAARITQHSRMTAHLLKLHRAPVRLLPAAYSITRHRWLSVKMTSFASMMLTCPSPRSAWICAAEKGKLSGILAVFLSAVPAVSADRSHCWPVGPATAYPTRLKNYSQDNRSPMLTCELHQAKRLAYIPPMQP